MYREDKERGTGRTTRQLMECPQGALFVWCNSHTEYPAQLAKDLGRRDINFLRRADLGLDRARRWVGRTYSAVICDHALEGLTKDELEGLCTLRDCCQKAK